MQTDAEDWSQPCLLARRVLVEHFGTVLTASPIHLPEKGYLDLSPGNFKEQGIGQLTVAEFEAKQLSPDYQLSRPWSAAKRRHSRYSTDRFAMKKAAIHRDRAARPDWR